METANPLTDDQRAALLDALQARFERNEHLHPGIAWEGVRAKLEKWTRASCARCRPWKKRAAGRASSRTTSSRASTCSHDCAPESPIGRRNLCYDRAAWEARKRNKPEGNAVDAAAAMGIRAADRGAVPRAAGAGEFDTRRRAGSKRPSPCALSGRRAVLRPPLRPRVHLPTTAPGPTTPRAASAARCGCSPALLERLVGVESSRPRVVALDARERVSHRDGVRATSSSSSQASGMDARAPLRARSVSTGRCSWRRARCASSR